MSKAKAVPLDRLRGTKKPFTRSVEIVLDADVAREIADVELELEKLDETSTDAAARLRREEAKARLDQLKADAIEAEEIVSFTFRAIGHKRFNLLVDAHPPTETQQKQANEAALELGLEPQMALHLARLKWNPETFPPVLIAAAALDPPITEEEAKALYNEDNEDWNAAEVEALFDAAVKAQERRAVIDLGNS